VTPQCPCVGACFFGSIDQQQMGNAVMELNLAHDAKLDEKEGLVGACVGQKGQTFAAEKQDVRLPL
jgi:hypothetical protein